MTPSSHSKARAAAAPTTSAGRARVRTLLLAALLGAVAAGSTEPPFRRGMVVSCPRYGQVWGSPAMAASLRELASLGVEWVAIHPYAAVARNGTVRFRPAAETGYLSTAVALAREAGISLFWKPHLAYWGSFEWRGTIQFGDDEAAWRRFFDGYRAFILDQARFAQEHSVPLLAVGTETEATTGREAEWRRLLAEVRRVYRGEITYGANWDSLGRVPFWDAVDLIGVQAYFPLTEEADPDRATLAAAWDAPLRLLEALATAHGKPVLLTEVGYNRSRDAAARPWSHVMHDDPGLPDLRRRLIEVALERVEATPFIEGMFWWKWMPGAAPRDRDFSMKEPEAREALRRYWGRPPLSGAGP